MTDSIIFLFGGKRQMSPVCATLPSPLPQALTWKMDMFLVLSIVASSPVDYCTVPGRISFCVRAGPIPGSRQPAPSWDIWPSSPCGWAVSL